MVCFISCTFSLHGFDQLEEGALLEICSRITVVSLKLLSQVLLWLKKNCLTVVMCEDISCWEVKRME